MHRESRSWRTIPLDGALLTFDRATGRSWVRRDSATAHLVQRAPRALQFGLTHACNLDCAFCSRDEDAGTVWTVELAYALLADLAEAGTLEVAFGGGEPFVFRGFAELVERLAATTPLALHATTNGRAITDAILERVAPHLGQLRVSIYASTDVDAVVPRLVRAVPVGANLLVTPATLPTLEKRVFALVDRGVRDVLFLAYKRGLGPRPRDATLDLSTTQHEELARKLDLLRRALPGLRIGVDVCFGSRLRDARGAVVPRVAFGAGAFDANAFGDGGSGAPDCGAGRDFVAITSDGRVHACSFHPTTLPGHTAGDVLAAFHDARARLRTAIDDPGCARTRPSEARRALPIVS